MRRLRPVPGLLVCALFLMLPVSVSAQISPGPLARPHEALEGSANCTNCHSPSKETMDRNCLSCHREIRNRIDSKQGLHAGIGNKRCASCHPDHAGRDFQLIFWGDGGIKTFDHARTGWPLDGKHAGLECRACHSAKFQKAEVTKLIRKKPASQSWLGLESRCAACHQDPHRGELGTECAKCHRATSWKEVADSKTFPHQLTRFPLRGKHASVACASCHDPVKAWGKKPRFDRCDSCHRDPHAGTATLAGARVDCASCHDEGGWSPSTFTVKQHKKTAYPLEGKHASVTCRSCHPGPKPGAKASASLGRTGVNLRPAHAACRDCHPAAHGNQLASRPDKGACESCHTVAGWKPSTFTTAAHDRLAFPLEGAHAGVACRNCHGPVRPGLPPLPAAKVTGPAKVMLALPETACRDCHADPHGNRYPAGSPLGDCRTCHSTTSFHRSLVDVSLHARFSYPLEGAHRAAPCVLCHKELDHPPAGSTLIGAPRGLPKLPFSGNRSRCRDCHRNPHGNQFTEGKGAKDCESCHDTTTFRPAVRFDHDRDARFPLAGAHERVPCARCHPTGSDASGRPRVLYKPLASACQSCHGA